MKTSAIRPAIVRVYEGNDCHATSAVIFNRKFVISPAAPLLAEKNQEVLESVLKSLCQDEPVGIYDDLAAQSRDFKCTVVPPGGKKEVPATLKFLFACKTIRKAFDGLLKSSPTLRLFKGDSLTLQQRSLLLSSFLVLELTRNVDDEKFSESHRPPTTANDFSVIATPYGNALMQGSTFNCQVANVIKGIIYLIDQPLSRGCEGGLLRSPLSDPLGMILTTTFESQNENLSLTFAGNLREILKELDGVLEVEEKLELFPLLIPKDQAAQSVVLIESGSRSHGTGALIRVEKRRLILTCSHVITDKENNFCSWQGRQFPLRLIYKNPHFDRPFDVAVFEAPKEIPSRAFCRPFRANPIIGEW